MQHQARGLLRPSVRTDLLFVALIIAFLAILHLFSDAQAATPEPICYVDGATGEWVCISWAEDQNKRAYLPIVAQ